MRVFVAGATGVIGRRLLPQLLSAGHQVVAMTRHAGGIDHLQALGAEGVVGDVFELERLHSVVESARPDAVIHQLTALPKRIAPRRVRTQLAPTNRLRRDGTRNLLAAAVAAGASRFIAQSIAFIHRPGPGGPARSEADEPYLDAPAAFRDVILAAVELETTTTAATELVGIALRYGLFYGPGTVYDADGGSFHEDVSRRRIPIVGSGAGVFNFVHVDDAAAATVLALERGESGVYQVTDDAPVTVAEFLPDYAARIGAPCPRRIPRWLGRLGAGPYGIYVTCQQPAVTSTRAREILGWTPSHASWRHS